VRNWRRSSRRVRRCILLLELGGVGQNLDENMTLLLTAGVGNGWNEMM